MLSGQAIFDIIEEELLIALRNRKDWAFYEWRTEILNWLRSQNYDVSDEYFLFKTHFFLFRTSVWVRVGNFPKQRNCFFFFFNYFLYLILAYYFLLNESYSYIITNEDYEVHQIIAYRLYGECILLN